MKLKNVHMGEGSGRGSGRVRLFVGNRGSGRVGSTFRTGRVGSGPRKVTRGQLWVGDQPSMFELYKVASVSALHTNDYVHVEVVVKSVYMSRLFQIWISDEMMWRNISWILTGSVRGLAAFLTTATNTWTMAPTVYWHLDGNISAS